MNLLDCSFLLLTSKLGNPNRSTLTTAQLRTIARRIHLLPQLPGDTKLSAEHLKAMGLDQSLIDRILYLLEDEELLHVYLSKAAKSGCSPITRTNNAYPLILRKRLGLDAPGCLWVKGDPEILKLPAVSLVGSRDLRYRNHEFAYEVGYQAAKQGYVLVSGNARGADITAQNACLEAGGCVISVVADALYEHLPRERVLYVSEEDFDEPFSSLRALRRNRVIHSLGVITFVAQCTFGKGGTWDGSMRNLKNMWSPLFCFQDGSDAMQELEYMGAAMICTQDLADFSQLANSQLSFL